MSSASKVLVMVGTRKGGFILTSDAQRHQWSINGPLFKGWNLMNMCYDPRDGRLHAAVDHFVYGATTHYSDDLGETWTQARVNPALPRPSKSAGRRARWKKPFPGRPFAETPETSDQGVEHHPRTPQRTGRAVCRCAASCPVQVHRPRRELGAGGEPVRPPAARGEWNPAPAGCACTPSCSTRQTPSACTSPSRRAGCTAATTTGSPGRRAT